MKTDFDLARDLVRRADGDYRAMHLLIDASGPPEVICFHAQQCAEKMLKALIVTSGLIPSWTHDLIRLLDELTPHHPALLVSRTDLMALNPYAVQSRYDMRVDPGLPEALAASARAEDPGGSRCDPGHDPSARAGRRRRKHMIGEPPRELREEERALTLWVLEHATDDASTAAAVEFMLEGLHVHNRLNKTVKAGSAASRR